MAKYYSALRPIDIGCYPKYDSNKVIEINNFDDRTWIDSVSHKAWGYIIYEQDIPEEDARHYSFIKGE